MPALKLRTEDSTRLRVALGILAAVALFTWVTVSAVDAQKQNPVNAATQEQRAFMLLTND